MRTGNSFLYNAGNVDLQTGNLFKDTIKFVGGCLASLMTGVTTPRAFI